MAARERFTSRIEEVRAERARSGVTEFNALNVITACIGGGVEAIRDEIAILMRPTHLTPRMLAHPPEFLLRTLAASLLLRRCSGEEVDGELAKLANLKGYKEASTRVVQAALQRILAVRRARDQPSATGYPEDEAEFRQLAERAAPPVPAQVALVPDGPLWGRLFGCVVPLAYEALAHGKTAPDLEVLGAFIRQGGDARPRELCYERRGGTSDGVWRQDVTEVPGFDAVELTAESVLVHHYMGVRWQAPLLLDSDVDAFHFLAHVDAGWAQVRATIGDDAWTRLVRARTERKTVHRVSIDPVNATEDPASTERARQRYGVEIEVVGFLYA
ncbi:hypothetical protein WME79_11445 [Sorangium sp. So ce726]|uniref:hypothetical protein n=1 Tax=Sorangium sp. So ce726 TaxID=3133319 RepID=UPI003F61A8FC